MTGSIAQAAFCVVYGRLAGDRHWGPALLAGSLAFAVATLALRSFPLSLASLVATVIGALVIALLLMPKDARSSSAARASSWCSRCRSSAPAPVPSPRRSRPP